MIPNLNLIGSICCAGITVLHILTGDYRASLGWIVAAMWATSAYLWSQTTERQNKLLDNIKTDLQKMVSDEVKQ